MAEFAVEDDRRRGEEMDSWDRAEEIVGDLIGGVRELDMLKHSFWNRFLAAIGKDEKPLVLTNFRAGDSALDIYRLVERAWDRNYSSSRNPNAGGALGAVSGVHREDLLGVLPELLIESGIVKLSEEEGDGENLKIGEVYFLSAGKIGGYGIFAGIENRIHYYIVDPTLTAFPDLVIGKTYTEIREEPSSNGPFKIKAEKRLLGFTEDGEPVFKQISAKVV